ncbi:cytochrome P450 [Apiospora sp. TS-2023a]
MVDDEEGEEEEEDVVDNDDGDDVSLEVVEAELDNDRVDNDTDEVVSDEEVEEEALVPLLVVVTPTELLGELDFDEVVDELVDDRPEGLCWHFFPAETSRMRIATGNAWDQESFILFANDSIDKHVFPTKPELVSSRIPVLGHLMHYLRDGPSYFTQLCLSTKASVFTIQIATAKVTLIQPELTRHLPKLRNVALNPLALDMFQRSLGFGKFSSALLQETDEASREVGRQASRMFRQEFIPDHRQKHYTERIDGYIQADLEKLSSQGLNVADWIFKTLVGSIGKVIWGGSDGPFDDADFLAHLRHFLLNVRALNNPATWFIDGNLLKSRRIVRERLAQSLAFNQARTEDEREPRENSEKKGDEGLLYRLCTLCRNHGAPPGGWIDYQLLLIAGLGPNIMSAATWLAYHILNDQHLLELIRHEIDQLIENSQESVIDLSEIFETCPLLYATWVEVLRFHSTFTLGRWVQENTTLAGTYHLPKGSYALAPLMPHHFDRAVWGDDADEFRPDRFLKRENGKFDHNAKKKVRVFGLFGTVCPGRFLATNMAMTLAIRLFSTLDMIPRAGEGFVLPKERKDTVVGMSSPDREIVMSITRRTSKKGVTVTWKPFSTKLPGDT